MKSIELKKVLSKVFDIPTYNLKVKNQDGWIKVYIRDFEKTKRGLENPRDIYDFELLVEKEILKHVEVSTWTADDGYNTEFNRVIVRFNDFSCI